MNLLARVPRSAPWLTLTLAIGLLAYTGTQLFQDASFRASPPAAAATAQHIPPPPRLPAPEAFISWQLFGPAIPHDNPAASAPETALSLTLRGILHDVNPGAARAIISGAGPRERVMAAGTALDGGIQLEQILPDKVLLRRAGRLEALSLNRHTPGMETAEPLPVLGASSAPDQPDRRHTLGATPARPAPSAPISPPATPSNSPRLDERASATLLQERRAALQQQIQAGQASDPSATRGEISHEGEKP